MIFDPVYNNHAVLHYVYTVGFPLTALPRQVIISHKSQNPLTPNDQPHQGSGNNNTLITINPLTPNDHHIKATVVTHSQISQRPKTQ